LGIVTHLPIAEPKLLALSKTELPFASGVTSVRFFRQALALDERRVKFNYEPRLINHESGKFPEIARECEERTMKTYPVTSREVWFMGCHSDVGGGNDRNDAPSLSDIPFRWMLREAELCGLIISPVGLTLLPATSEVTSVEELFPRALKDVLKGQLEGYINEQDATPRVKQLVKPNFSPEVIRAIIGKAAQQDTIDPELVVDGVSGSPNYLLRYKKSMRKRWVWMEAVPFLAKDTGVLG
jgi:hypothetical protein